MNAVFLGPEPDGRWSDGDAGHNGNAATAAISDIVELWP